MSLFLERLVNGLADGSIYALLALALVVVFRSTGQLNFAQGEIGTMGAFFVSTLTLTGLPVWLSIGCAMLLGFVISAGVERIVVRPIEHRNPGAVIVALIGVFLFWSFGILGFRQTPWVLAAIAGIAPAPTIVAANGTA